MSVVTIETIGEHRYMNSVLGHLAVDLGVSKDQLIGELLDTIDAMAHAHAEYVSKSMTFEQLNMRIKV